MELRTKTFLTPSEMKRFGKRVRYFDVNSEWKPKQEQFHDAKVRVSQQIEDYIKETGGQVYTGHHSENDWTRTIWWQMGFHYVNRTLEFAVLISEEQFAIRSGGIS